MNCSDVRLEEYLDGELEDAAREAVEAHLNSCGTCRQEMAALRRLEEVLRAAPAGAPPEAGRFLEEVRRRSRRPRWGPWAAAAAIPLAAALVVLVARRSSGEDLEAALARYARSPAPAEEAAFRAAGRRGLEVLEASLEKPDPRVQFAAASLLFRLSDDGTRDRLVARFQGAVDVRAELERYARTPSGEIEARIRSAGPVGLAVLERALEDRDARVRFAAATLLFRHADGPTRDWVFAHFQQRREPNGGWALLEPGTEEEDVELVPVAMSALEAGGERRWAMDILQKLHRLDRESRKEIVGSVVTLLKHPNPKVQALALDIVKELDIEFPLGALVDLLDSPDLGDEALKVLRRATGKDLGKDREAWRKAVAMMEKGL